MEGCGFCKDREVKIRHYEEEIEKQKVRECQKALEREKIAKGMRCTKEDEVHLREMQKMQMQEKKSIEQEQEELDHLWHRVLLDQVQMKEQYERADFERRKQEMLERRRAYDEQIASANSKRREALRQERDKENRRLEKIREKMERDHQEETQRKREQQMLNRRNFIEGHETKMSRIESERMRDKRIDDNSIRVALEGLRKERIRNKAQMHNLQVEKKIFVENYNRERRMAAALEEDAEKITGEWKQQAEDKADEHYRNVEAEKVKSKQKAAEEYRRHINERNMMLERDRQERSERMKEVNRTAINELQRRFDSANDELRRQVEYRSSLTNQIRENQRILQTQLNDIENKEKPFTKKPEMFKDAMENKIAISPGRKSTNPVHPFKRMMEIRGSNTSKVQLPLIEKCRH